MSAVPGEDLAARGAAATWPEIQQQPEVWREVARIVTAEASRVQGFLEPVLAQAQLPAGVVTGAVGAPVMLWLLVRQRRGALA